MGNHHAVKGEDVAPEQSDAVAPWVMSADSAAEIEFLQAVFGAQERPGSRVTGADGSIVHVEVDLQGYGLLLSDATPQWPGVPAHVRVYVADLEKVLATAVERGAVVFTEATASPFGDIVARFRDPQGHRWWIHQYVEDVAADDRERRMGEEDNQRALAYIAGSLSEEMARDPA